MGLFSSAPASHFPVVKGRRLDDTKVRFPHDLPADATLLIVSFLDDLDPLADQWARLGERMVPDHDGRFAVLEVPVVSSKLKMLGSLATMGVRGQVETDEEHARTIPIFVDVKPFRKKLKLKSRDVYPILVARDGRIAWRGDGDIDMDEVAELEAAIAEVLAAPIPPLTDHPDIDEDDLTDDVDADADAEDALTAEELEDAEADAEADDAAAVLFGDAALADDADAPDETSADTPDAPDPDGDRPPGETEPAA